MIGRSRFCLSLRSPRLWPVGRTLRLAGWRRETQRFRSGAPSGRQEAAKRTSQPANGSTARLRLPPLADSLTGRAPAKRAAAGRNEVSAGPQASAAGVGPVSIRQQPWMRSGRPWHPPVRLARLLEIDAELIRSSRFWRRSPPTGRWSGAEAKVEQWTKRSRSATKRPVDGDGSRPVYGPAEWLLGTSARVAKRSERGREGEGATGSS